ncbi:hypothetical protein E5F05_08755 [Deinococcus metallilatus]|uniref:Uncharacterized protein n=1 Tax=Deinococcus metallilatus TaxID=1211322 RepID=A0AAJ5F4P4_9DEIO|nr:hypothetical protein [Deinococcus metallilatus]MBB5295448.1 hypothetical protein [Deinococcus metallilatus]QBY08030.1 hypothetical protein E5F05_08755 [Deinococcus metallilatus]RXJ12923.1 hypothetical protein ERJ73_07580 [Deinococcus metallilatus]TLK27155.1 hypothetical protein FCS05_09735 [Deinococcus metallilatus]GMA16126.1 hypothetical protein GCM10025871_24570 [Deinococcus metallilatus]
MKLMRPHIVTPDLREVIAIYHSEVFGTPAFTHLAQHLLFGRPGTGEEEKGHVVTSTEMFDVILAGTGWKKYSKVKFLDRFQQATGIGLKVREHEYVKGLARAIQAEFHPEVVAVFEQELRARGRKDRVFFDTGSKVTPDNRLLAFRQAEAAQRGEFQADRLNAPILRYFLDEVSTNAYAKFRKNLDIAIALAELTETDPHRQRAVLTNLHRLRDTLKPIYEQKPGTNRVFAQGYSLQSLPKHYRDLLMPGSVEADLKSCHLVIAAFDWQVQPLIKVLERGQSIWTYLADAVGTDSTPEAKAGLKSAIYAVLYGGGRDRIKSYLPADQHRAFLHDPVVKALLDAREAQMRCIKEAGGLLTVGGELIPLGERHPRELLVRRAQDIETHIIAVCYEVAERHTKDFRIVSAEHDGFRYDLLDKRRGDKVQAYLLEAVQKRSAELNLPMTMEFSRAA